MSNWYKTQHYNFDTGDGNEIIVGSLWRNDTDDLYLYKIGSYYYISETIGSVCKLDGTAITTYFYKCNGYRYFSCAGGYLWYDTTSSKWTISIAPNFGTASTNSYWTCSTLTGTYTAQGVATGTKEVTKELNGWRKSSYEIHGLYEAVGNESGTKRVGVFRFELGECYDSTSPRFDESYDLYGGYRVCYGYPYVYSQGGYQTTVVAVVWWDGTNWIVSKTAGTKDEAIGYWTGGTDTGNQTLGTYTLTCSDEETELPETMTASSFAILGTTSTKDIYLTECGVWL